jgi:hypothetical protein
VIIGALITGGLTLLATHQQTNALADQQGRAIEAQADQQLTSYLRAERTAAYARMTLADIAAQADQQRFHEMMFRPNGPSELTDAERNTWADRVAANIKKLQNALAEVSIVGSADAISAATTLVAAHQGFAQIVYELAGRLELAVPGKHLYMVGPTMREVLDASQAFTKVVRQDLRAETGA